MTNARYQDAARLLGGKYQAGVPGVRRPRLFGAIGAITYEAKYLADTETVTTGVIFKATKHQRRNWHEYRLDYRWSDQPMTVRWTGGDVICVPEVASELAEVSVEQIVQLYEAFSSWPSLKVTNHGFEWIDPDSSDHTAQRIAVLIQAQARVLQKLKPAHDKHPGSSPITRIKQQMPSEALKKLRALPRKPRGAGSDDSGTNPRID